MVIHVLGGFKTSSANLVAADLAPVAAAPSAECVWGDWEPWGECDCGDGLEKRHRYPADPASCELMLMAESRACSC
jgi:hypothetical protein